MKNVDCYIKDYPRPQFVNPLWNLLNGEWDFSFDDDEIGEKEEWYKKLKKDKTIIVPFAFETLLSGINLKEEHKCLWYSKEVKIDSHKDKRVILNFEGSDYITKVWVNGIYVGKHQGGYTRFSFDITDEIKENKAYIVVRTYDEKDAFQPRGKQTWLEKPFGCWYTETGGLWKSVWIEYVPLTRLSSVKVTPLFESYKAEFEITLNRYSKNHSLKIQVLYDKKEVSSIKIDLLRKITNIEIDMHTDSDGFRIQYWTPNKPNLYDINYTLYESDEIIEEIGSYFGFRSLSPENNLLRLNNNPVYMKMVLHQGYYKDSGLTAPNSDALLKDVMLAKELGFNGIRMHQKIEDEQFYYFTDIVGMMVWCEMPSCYEFKDATITNLIKEWMDVVKQNYNHPSIVAWVPINESWGVPRIVLDEANQSLDLALYYMTKAYDTHRMVISNDGWEHTKSDIITLHNYAQSSEELLHIYKNIDETLKGNYFTDYSQTRIPFSKGFEYHNEPVIISEFGGTGYKQLRDDGWGYNGVVKSAKEYIDRLTDMFKALRSIDGICGYCFTQLTDVDQEINGLLDMERNPKVDIEKIKAIIDL